MREVLESRYRLLLLAYPARYRRVRGLEMLTTLMDLAPEGRRRPSFGDSVSLLFGGLRCRLSLRGAPWPVAVLVALFVAVLGASAGAIAGWQIASPQLPADAEALTLARTADPRMPEIVTDRRDFLFGYDIPVQEHEKALVALLGGDEYTPGYVQFTLPHPEDGLATIRAAHERLRATGWGVDPIQDKPYGAEFDAIRDGLFVHIVTQGGGSYHETSLWISRATPALVPILTALGLLFGGVLGWRLGIWAARRAARQSTSRKALATTAFALGSLLLLPPSLFNLVALFASLGTREPVPVWIGYVFIFTRGFALFGSLSLVAALLIAALRPANRRVLAA